MKFDKFPLDYIAIIFACVICVCITSLCINSDKPKTIKTIEKGKMCAYYGEKFECRKYFKTSMRDEFYDDSYSEIDKDIDSDED